MNAEMETMADAVTAMVETFAQSTSVAGGSCGEGCTDTWECDKWEESWSESF